MPVTAGMLYRFAAEMRVGDLVVYPSKADRMVNVGEVSGAYRFDPEAGDAPGAPGYETAHARRVAWHAQVPRTLLPQAALNEIGSALTFFAVANNPEPFHRLLTGEALEEEAETDEDARAATEAQAERAEDFVLRRLKGAITPERFEQFVAHLLTCMGYHARVTRLSGDGGIDVIAHRDELGFAPPVIKVQCKQILTTIGRPDVQRLMGAVEAGEFGLFVTLGEYSREAREMERMRPNLRLIDGAGLCGLVFAHYGAFAPDWRATIPLASRYVPAPPAGA